MEVIETNHYEVLGLPSGIEATKLTKGEITKAYHTRALKLHPDKNPKDPNSKDNFQLLISSYELLMDEKSRKIFDDSLFRMHEQQHGRLCHRSQKTDTKLQSTTTITTRTTTKTTREDDSNLQTVHLRVAWQVSRGYCNYSVSRLTELFAQFGHVKQVVRLLKRRTETTMVAIVTMVSKDAENLFSCIIMSGVLGDVSNPLLVKLSSITKPMN